MTKATILISTGIDSPVAASIMNKKGLELAGVHLSTMPNSKEVVAKLCRKVGIKRLYVSDFMDVQKQLIEKCKRKMTCILCKRIMLKIAEKIAEKEGCTFLVTGDNLGQVASQTLENIAVLTSAVKMPILRPLLCNDKQETIDRAQKIGTYDLSSEIGICCNAVPRSPTTKTTIKAAEIEEKKIDINKIVENAVECAEVINL